MDDDILKARSSTKKEKKRKKDERQLLHGPSVAAWTAGRLEASDERRRCLGEPAPRARTRVSCKSG